MWVYEFLISLALAGDNSLRIPMWVYESLVQAVSCAVSSVTNPHVGL